MVLQGDSSLNDLHWDSPFADPEITRDVHALAVTDDGELCVGGFFGGAIEPFNYVARWEGRYWSKLGPGGANGVTGPVNVLLANGNDVYVGGAFGSINTGPTGPVWSLHGIARWDGRQWWRLGGDTDFGVIGSVKALARDGTNLYVGGRFMGAGGISLTNVAKWNGREWSALGAGLGDFENDRVTALAVGPDGTLYAGGSFLTSGGRPVRRLARWDGCSNRRAAFTPETLPAGTAGAGRPSTTP